MRANTRPQRPHVLAEPSPDSRERPYPARSKHRDRPHPAFRSGHCQASSLYRAPARPYRHPEWPGWWERHLSWRALSGFEILQQRGRCETVPKFQCPVIDLVPLHGNGFRPRSVAYPTSATALGGARCTDWKRELFHENHPRLDSGCSVGWPRRM